MDNYEKELTKEQEDFGHAFCAENEWGFDEFQIRAMALAIRDCQYENTDVDTIANHLHDANVKVPLSIKEKNLLVKYIAYLFEDVNYHDESVLAENFRWSGICRLWGIEFN